jgi:hypothetical protein
MPRCSHCGKVNREGSLFCQDCGHRLEAAAAAPAAKPSQPAGGAVCSACGTANPPGMNFCKMCGTSLAAKPAIAATMMASDLQAASAAQPAVAPAAQPGKVGCPACGKQTPAGFSFCQHCGQRLGGAPAASPAKASPSSVVGGGGAPAAHMNPTPPAGMARASAPPTASRASSEDAMAKTMAPTPEMMAQVRAASQARPAVPIQQPAVQKPSIEPYKPDTLVDGKAGPAKFGSLVGVNRDGSDGDTIELTGDAFDIGRTEGSLNFGDDPYLAARHARLLPSGGKVTLRPLDTVNGVYLRVHGACDLGPGDQFLVGKELLRFEPCAPEERDPPSLVEHGVRLFGSAPREAWGRLRQLTVAGTTRDVWHLVRPELVLGREEGDVTFPDDEFMSRRHAAVKKVGPKAKLEDLGSSNGTFVRIRADRELKPGDVLRMGDQLLRFEL